MENNNFLPVVSLYAREDFRLYSEKDFTNPLVAVEEVGKFIYNRDREYMMLIAMDCLGRPICVNVVSIGDTVSCTCVPREVLRILTLANATGFILMHNHPSGGSLKPSRRDNVVTDRFVQLSKLSGITLLDSIIVAQKDGKPAFFSYRERKKKMISRPIKDFLQMEFKVNKEDFPDVPPVLEGWADSGLFLTAYSEEQLEKLMESGLIKEMPWL